MNFLNTGNTNLWVSILWVIIYLQHNGVSFDETKTVIICFDNKSNKKMLLNVYYY